MKNDNLWFDLAFLIVLSLIIWEVADLRQTLQETNKILEYHFECEEAKNELVKDKRP